MAGQRIAQRLRGAGHPCGMGQALAFWLQVLQYIDQQVRRLQAQHQAAIQLATVVARREVRYAAGAVEIDGEVEISLAARRARGDVLHGLHAALQQLAAQVAGLIQIDVDAGIAQVAIRGNQRGQQRHFGGGARLANRKADAAAAGVQLGQQLGDMDQPGLRAGGAAGVQVLAKRVADDADGLHRIACLLFQRRRQAITLALGLGQRSGPAAGFRAQREEGSDSANAHQGVQSRSEHGARAIEDSAAS